MSFTSSISKILSNKKTLHIVFAIALLNLIGYLVTGNFDAFVFFMLITIVMGHFSKNITIILLVALFIVNLFVLGKKTKEGMENSNSNSNSTQDASGNTTQPNIQKIKDKVSTQQGLPITPVDNTSDTNTSDTNTSDTNTNTNTNTNTTEESFEVGRNKKGKYDIDYASTIEDAYDELNKIIGGDGIQKLTGDTQNLMKQQMQLAEAMKGMGPLIEKMGPLMESVAPMLENAKGFMGNSGSGIADLAKNFTAGANKK